jgi:hypothetical protein
MRQHTQMGRSLRWAAAFVFVASAAAPGCRSKEPRVVPDVLAPPVVAPASARTSLALSIYSRGNGGGDGYAFVREERKVRLPAGRFVLSAPDIASDMVPETTRFQLISANEDGDEQVAGELYEQRYLYDRLTPERLLEKAEGQRVTAVWWAGFRKGRERSITGTVISSKQGVVMKLDSGEVVPVDGRVRFYFSALPPDLVAEPTLKWNVGSFEAIDATLKLSYRAERFAWRADYVINLAKDQATADVEGWVTVVNQGDTAFEQAKLQLVAGTVNTVDADIPPAEEAQKAVYFQALDMEDRARTGEETLGDLHLYTVEHPTTLPARSSKQVRFVLARGVPVVLEAETTVPLETGTFPAELKAKIDNEKKGALGVALPAGVARSNMLSNSGTLIQVGDGGVEHTPAGEPWRVPIGDDANQLTRVRIEDEKPMGRGASGEMIARYTIEVQLRNAADAPRHRRVVIEPRYRRFVGLPTAGGAMLEGPKRLVIETDLAAGKVQSYKIVVDVADPNDVRDEPVLSLPGLSR